MAYFSIIYFLLIHMPWESMTEVYCSQ